MFAIFEINGSPAIPFEKVIKVDPIFHDEKEDKKFGFSVHLGEQNKRCNFYFESEDSATTSRNLFLKQWNNYFLQKFELIE